MIRRGRLLGQALSLVEDEVEGISRLERLYLGHHEGVKVRIDISLCGLGLGGLFFHASLIAWASLSQWGGEGL
jgi:hypothetical protein